MHGVEDRQNRIEGFEQSIFSAASVTMIGAGGIGSEICEGLVRKGIGTLEIFDYDDVEISNLNRQLFFEDDLGKNKAEALAQNLSRMGFLGTHITAYPHGFEDALDMGIAPQGDILVAGVDDDETRIEVSRFALRHDKPMVSLATDRQASFGMCFVQQLGTACYSCLYPNAGNTGAPEPCEPAAAVKDVLKLLGALGLYTIDTVLMKRPRTWTFREIHLASPALDKSGVVQKRPDCPACGNQSPL